MSRNDNLRKIALELSSIPPLDASKVQLQTAIERLLNENPTLEQRAHDFAQAIMSEHKHGKSNNNAPTTDITDVAASSSDSAGAQNNEVLPHDPHINTQEDLFSSAISQSIHPDNDLKRKLSINSKDSGDESDDDSIDEKERTVSYGNGSNGSRP